MNKNGDVVEILEQLYDDYCSGYSFLRLLGLTYITGIDSLPKIQQRDNWDESEFNRKREILNKVELIIINEAKRILSYFQEGLIKIVDENTYRDYRSEKDKVELTINCEELDIQRKSSVIIDVSNIKTSKELHLTLKESLEFPNFYGENWDAFWDSITGLVELPEKIEFVGWRILEINLPKDVAILKELLINYNNKSYGLKTVFIFN
ncbi:barstar family protein [Bacillus spongiae]|uniref:barstar family protein n=1 Tax=Bacillus spongiae TaxID=2683610 RepID=UPI003AF9E21A